VTDSTLFLLRALRLARDWVAHGGRWTARRRRAAGGGRRAVEGRR
jgi:hypothetical protein